MRRHNRGNVTFFASRLQVLWQMSTATAYCSASIAGHSVLFVLKSQNSCRRPGTTIIAVRASNAPEPDVAPLSGDFNVFGGLYRPVHFIETDEICFALTDHASPGVAWLQMSVTEDQAVLDVNVEISNSSNRNEDLTLAADVFDAAGNRVANVEQPVAVVPEVTAPFALRRHNSSSPFMEWAQRSVPV